MVAGEGEEIGEFAGHEWFQFMIKNLVFVDLIHAFKVLVPFLMTQ